MRELDDIIRLAVAKQHAYLECMRVTELTAVA